MAAEFEFDYGEEHLEPSVADADQDEVTLALTASKPEELAQVLDALTLAEPKDMDWLMLEGFASAYAALQRQALVDPVADRLLRGHASQARRVFVDSGYWSETFQDMYAGRATNTQLQLVLFGVISDRKGMRLFPDRVGSALATMHPKVSVIENTGLEAMKHDREARHYLRLFVLDMYGEHYSIGSGHLLVTAFHHLLRESGMLDTDKMSLEHPDPILAGLTDELSKLMDRARSSGEYGNVPQRIWRTHRALMEYWGDVQAHRAGNPVVGRQANRLWRHEFSMSSEEEFTMHLKERRAFTHYSNTVLTEMLTAPPPDLRWFMAENLRDLIDEGDTAEHNLQINEHLGIVWAALCLRRDEPACLAVLHEFEAEVRPYLEMYVLDGLALIEEGFGPFWLRYVAFHSLIDKEGTGVGTVFTPEYEPVVNDRRRAGDALSQWLRIQLKQAKTNTQEVVDLRKSLDFIPVVTRSAGYRALSPELAISVAYYLWHQLTVEGIPAAARTSMRRDFDDLVRSASKLTLRMLPANIQSALGVRTYPSRKLKYM